MVRGGCAVSSGVAGLLRYTPGDKRRYCVRERLVREQEAALAEIIALFSCRSINYWI